MLLMSERNKATFTLAVLFCIVALIGGIYSLTQRDLVFGVLGLVVAFGMLALAVWARVAGSKDI